MIFIHNITDVYKIQSKYISISEKIMLVADKIKFPNQDIDSDIASTFSDHEKKILENYIKYSSIMDENELNEAMDVYNYNICRKNCTEACAQCQIRKAVCIAFWSCKKSNILHNLEEISNDKNSFIRARAVDAIGYFRRNPHEFR